MCTPVSSWGSKVENQVIWLQSCTFPQTVRPQIQHTTMWVTAFLKELPVFPILHRLTAHFPVTQAVILGTTSSLISSHWLSHSVLFAESDSPSCMHYSWHHSVSPGLKFYLSLEEDWNGLHAIAPKSQIQTLLNPSNSCSHGVALQGLYKIPIWASTITAESQPYSSSRLFPVIPFLLYPHCNPTTCRCAACPGQCLLFPCLCALRASMLYP